ncbi:MAG: hypothetical protein AB7H77_00960 [Bdellovibrionales bacterium]
MRVLYLGLSNNIQGVAEAFAANGDAIRLLKPGEKSSRLAAAIQALERNPADIIIIGEAIGPTTGLPQTTWIIEGIRKAGIGIPVAVLSNNINKNFGQQLQACSACLLPLVASPRNSNIFFPIASVLLSTASGLIGTSQNHVPQAIETHKPQNLIKKIDIGGHSIELSGLRNMLACLFISAQDKILSRKQIHQALYGPSTAVSMDAVRIEINRLNQAIKGELFNKVTLPPKFNIIEVVGKQGWRLSISNIKFLEAQQSAAKVITFPLPSVHKSATTPYTLGFGGLALNCADESASLYGNPLSFTPTHTKIIRRLMQSRGNLVTRGELYAACYPPGSTASEAVISNYVRQANVSLVTQFARLGYKSPHSIIETIGKQGWRLSGKAFGDFARVYSEKNIKPHRNDVVIPINGIKAATA